MRLGVRLLRGAGRAAPRARGWRQHLCMPSLSQLQHQHQHQQRRCVSSEEIASVVTRAEMLHKTVLGPLNQQWQGPLEKNHDQMTKLPFVFLLGNHSSGKSTFINYVLGREIQNTGVAPTDDSFTVITPGVDDADQDGPSLVGEPDMGFEGLRTFGPALVHHMQLKVRTGLSTEQFMMVDSPGMIDSPALTPDDRLAERGYDFEAVTRWFAEHADVILLFFDPDKPGTTGETLSVLTSALTGHDHKLHIVLNKVDQFAKIHDFARAYGSLCWNLSKVIHRKDLPRIYTMYVPLEGTTPVLDKGLGDLQSAREEIVDQVMRAPERRIDNVITKLYDSTSLLAMHLRVGDAIRRDFVAARWRSRGVSGIVGLGGAALTAAAFINAAPWQVLSGVSVVSALSFAGSMWYGSTLLQMKAKALTSEQGMTEHFHRQYMRQVVDNDENVFAMWRRVQPQLRVALETKAISGLPALSTRSLERLEDILNDDVPNMRRKTSPTKSTSFLGAIADVFRGKEESDGGAGGAAGDSSS